MEDELDGRSLRRIIAKLLALADSAERAAGRCFPIRFLVLLVLRRAEAAARDYVLDTMEAAWFSAGEPLETTLAFMDDPGGRGGFGAGDAALLAQRLRALAALLVAVLGEADSSLDTERGTGRMPARPGARTPSGTPAPRPTAPDALATGPPILPRSPKGDPRSGPLHQGPATRRRPFARGERRRLPEGPVVCGGFWRDGAP